MLALFSFPRYSKEPMFIRKPRSSEATEGDTVIIQCEVIGDPKPDVYWLRDFLKVCLLALPATSLSWTHVSYKPYFISNIMLSVTVNNINVLYIYFSSNTLFKFTKISS